MTGRGPSILVVADDPGERVLIAATLREVGFTAVTGSGGCGGPFAAAVIAAASRQVDELLDEVRRRGPGLPVLLVLDPAAMRQADEDGAAVLMRPLDERRLLGGVFGLVLREEDEPANARRHGRAAELGITAARLACLCNRRAIAAAGGASRLVHDLTHQIGEMQTAFDCLAAPAPAG